MVESVNLWQSAGTTDVSPASTDGRMARGTEMIDLGRLRRAAASDASLRGRLEYGTFVSTRYRYLYVSTPKVACTSIKLFLHSLEELPPIQPFSGAHESKLSMFIHDRQQFGLPSILELTPTLQEQALNASGWFRFALVRNPYSRLFSAWQSKIRTVEPDFEHVAGQIRHSFPDGALPTFPEFVDFVCDREDLSTCDAHWQLQSGLAFSDLLRHSILTYKLEAIGVFIDAFSAHLRAAGYRQPVWLPAHNEGPGIEWRRFYDGDLAGRVYAKYRRDFEEFDYPRDSWRVDLDHIQHAQGDAFDRMRTYYEREIYERNRLISALYALVRD